MNSVVSGLTAGDVVQDPFPHIVVRDALDPAISDRLIDEFPPLEVVTRGKPYRSNQRFSYWGSEAMNDVRLSPLWRELVRTHQSQEFLDELLRLFAVSIRSTYPWFEDRFGSLDTLRAGIRFRDTHDDSDVLLEAQPSINTPVTALPTSVRAGHLDKPNKLFVGLYYLRHPADVSTGGDLELYRYKSALRVFEGHEISHRYIEPVKTITYERNVAIFFLNTPRSLHGVTPRSQTATSRLFLNVGAEVSGDLFELPGRQAEPSRVAKVARRSIRTAPQRALVAAVLAATWVFLFFVFLPEELGDRPYDVFGLRF